MFSYRVAMVNVQKSKTFANNTLILMFKIIDFFIWQLPERANFFDTPSLKGKIFPP
jgi:hypothetical protein